MNYRASICLALSLLCKSAVAQERVPDGFKLIDGASRIRLSAAVVKPVIAESHGSNRVEAVTRYIAMLSSGNVTSRCFAAWALGQFQSQRSWDALFAQAENEKQENVLRVIADSLAGLSGGGLPGSTDIVEGNAREQLSTWRDFYHAHGYLGVFRQKYKEWKGNLEGEGMLVGCLADWLSPELVPVVHEIEKETSFEQLRLRCKETALKSEQIGDVNRQQFPPSSIRLPVHGK